MFQAMLAGKDRETVSKLEKQLVASLLQSGCSDSERAEKLLCRLGTLASGDDGQGAAVRSRKNKAMDG